MFRKTWSKTWFINFFQRAGGSLLPFTCFGRWSPSTISKRAHIGRPLNSANACRPYHISHSIMPKLYMSALLSCNLKWKTSGAMYREVPAMSPRCTRDVLYVFRNANNSNLHWVFLWELQCKRKKTSEFNALLQNIVYFYTRYVWNIFRDVIDKKNCKREG